MNINVSNTSYISSSLIDLFPPNVYVSFILLLYIHLFISIDNLIIECLRVHASMETKLVHVFYSNMISMSIVSLISFIY